MTDRKILSSTFWILVLILLLVALATPVQASFTPVYMHYYCRQQCEQRFKMCAMGAISGPKLASCYSIRGVCYMRC
ncbi:hypothetical protein L204_100658 [Cryptococcus depauperatus]